MMDWIPKRLYMIRKSPVPPARATAVQAWPAWGASPEFGIA